MEKTRFLGFENDDKNILRGVMIRTDHPQTMVIMCHGFERAATTEKKFKVLADELYKRNISSYRFDFRGCGLSDGDFSTTTVLNLSRDLKNAYNFITETIRSKNVMVVGHSLAACVIAKLYKERIFDKMVLLSPALNQKSLLRYYYAQREARDADSITWENYKENYSEIEFQLDCASTERMSKANFIGSGISMENKDMDYASLFLDKKNILHIHGDSDKKVPLESVSLDFDKRIIVEGGDHDLERPDMREKWLDKTIDFLSVLI